MTRSSQPTMSTDDASALRRRRPPVVRINLDPAADGARGDDCADREPCELSERGEPVGPAPELSEAARGDDWALSEASSFGSRLMRTTGGRRRRRVLVSSAVDIFAELRVKRLLLLFNSF